MAERLSADPDCRVTILEAGPGPDAPGVSALTGNGLQLPIGGASPLVARFATRLTDRPARTMNLVRGATVGGSGAVNGGYFCRALPADLDGWALPGWSWADVLPHFRAIETDLDFPGAPAHGDRGPIRVRRAHEIVGATASFIESAAQAGYPWVDDVNDGATDTLPAGIGLVPSNIVDGVRTGAGAAFLVPAGGRPNLAVLSGTRALQVMFDGARATGVRVLGPGGAQVLTADRIVLSAGAIGSAHLLMLSGIGDEAMLRAVGVPVVVAAPVGLRTADHPEWVLPTDWPVAASRPVLEVVWPMLVNTLAGLPWAGFGAGTDKGMPNRAKPEIWTNKADFTAKADALVTATKALAAATAAEDKDAFASALASVGGACKGCHDSYQAAAPAKPAG